MKVNPKIKDFIEPNKKDITRILNAIKRYDRIAVFRHSMPDFDALGTQMGLATWLKDNFPNKEIHVLGDNHVTFTPRLYPEMDRLSEEWFNQQCRTGRAGGFSRRRKRGASHEKAVETGHRRHHRSRHRRRRRRHVVFRQRVPQERVRQGRREDRTVGQEHRQGNQESLQVIFFADLA